MTEPPEPTTLEQTPTEAIDVLAHKYRAYTIDVLNTHDSLDIDTLAELIADRDPDDTATRSDIATALRHRHLPILTNANVVQKTGETLSTDTHLDALSAAYAAFCDELQ